MEKKVNRPEEKEKKSKPADMPYNPEVTKEDKQALNAKGRSMNKGQDKALDRKRDVDFTADELDVPASNANLPDKEGRIPDEQNWQYNKKGARPDQEKSKDHPGSDEKL
ncbi:hypothetical protein [Christiangramia sediminis]|uniref:Uncharacterized protein n=1 Tax=Christiangramia sediminis TaxID=2881336 RepID=A0A9X1LH07_9FLAO|nr:hypothetical protein [Christiangramia sediminis]MCB7480128.1 hypothetical protein [Christiangramia sediminis]